MGDSEFGPEGSLLDLQLKGAGMTPFSRQADGRAVLRSSIREFLASEAMFYLGVPTTRAASMVVSTETKVKRDKLYNGNAKDEKCAVVMRVAPTFMRFGSFEIFRPIDSYTSRSGPSFGKKNDMMPTMLDYVVKNFYTEIRDAFENSSAEERYLLMFEEIVSRTAKTAAYWQCYGFCHGVLNTDNMSILGLTIDYGPYGFMEHFNPKHICNHSDNEGRYRYEAQPDICEENLMMLADALDPIIPRQKTFDYVKDNYQKMYKEKYLTLMYQKLGLVDQGVDPERIELYSSAEAEELISELWELMTVCGSDFTNTFRDLSKLSKSSSITEEDEPVIQTLCKANSAPKEALLMRLSSKYESNP